MSKQEGVIQFNLSHQDGVPINAPEIDVLVFWHQRMHALTLIGQDPSRYEGYAYGNMSHRLNQNEFIISGTQTGGISHLSNKHYAHVIDCDIKNNTVQSRGPIKPSSECMSHAAIYAAKPSIMAVIHVHNPDIWQQHQPLQLATTAMDIEYGTPEMAIAIQQCIQHSHDCIAMLGHLDGVICCANNLEIVGQRVINLHQQANNLI